MKMPLMRLKENLDQCSNSERNVAEYILEHPDHVAQISIHELSKTCYSSPSTIIRLTKLIGCSGYKEFKEELLIELTLDKDRFIHSDGQIQKQDSLSTILDKIIAVNLKSIEDTKKLMDIETLEKSVKLMQQADSILFFGIGASHLVAKDAYLKFIRLNKSCRCDEDWHTQLMTARNATSKDVAIVLSYSGYTSEMVECMKELKLHHTPIIAITRCINCPVNDLADYRLYTTSLEPIYRNGAIASRHSQLCIIDMLYATYTSKDYDYCLQQLSKTHIEKS